MDILTQGIAGALFAQLGAKPEYQRHATLAGFAAGLLPDADALIHSTGDPLLTLEFHRQFSHSLLFIPIGALIITLILLPFLHKKLPLKLLYLFCLLGYSSAGLLDACTSYGTQLLWPFVDTRIAWNLISIVDPVFTISILTLVIIGWRKQQRRYPVAGLGFAGLYLLLSLSQQYAAATMQQSIAQQRGHQIERSVIKPTMGNILLWRSIYQYKGRYYIDAIRPGMIAQKMVYTGNSIPTYQPNKNRMGIEKPTTQYHDILRFNKLSNRYLVIHPQDNNVIGDIRYAMLPTSVEPLWGIRLDSSKPQQHATEALFRTNDTKIRQQFITMLRGKAL